MSKNGKSDTTDVTINVETITPEQAEDLLGRNVNNRSVRASVVKRYAADMAAGKWVLNGAPINISATGNLIDGQHRLAACVEAGVPFTTVIMRGLDEDTAKPTIDSGVKRTMMDVMHWRGYKDPAVTAGALTTLYGWAHGRMRRSGRDAVSHTEQLAFLDTQLDLEQLQVAARMARQAGRPPLSLPPSPCAAFLYGALQVDEEEVLNFWQLVKTGAGLGEGDPIYAFRRWAMNRSEYTHGSVILAVLIKTWNAWLEGREVRNVSFKPGGTRREAFPILHGSDLTDVWPSNAKALQDAEQAEIDAGAVAVSS